MILFEILFNKVNRINNNPLHPVLDECEGGLVKPNMAYWD